MNTVANMRIITNEISFKDNKLPVGNFSLSPTFSRTTGVTPEGMYFTELSVSILNTPEVPFPYDVQVSITGIFELENQPEDYIKTFLEVNAVQILFPYIRSMVTSLTTSAMVPPIILPIINPQTLFDGTQENKD